MASTKLPGNIGIGNYISNSEWFRVFVFKNSTLVNDLTQLSNSISQKTFLQKVAQLFDSAASGLKGFTLYPFAVDVRQGVHPESQVVINTVYTQVDMLEASDTVDENVQFEISVPNATTGTSPDIKHLEPATKSFIDYEPFSSYMMYIPFVGVIDLHAYKIFGKTLTLRYVTDLHTGGAQVTLDNGTETLFSDNVQLGVTVPFGFTDQGAKDVARALQCIKLGASMGMAGGTTTVESEVHEKANQKSPSETIKKRRNKSTDNRLLMTQHDIIDRGKYSFDQKKIEKITPPTPPAPLTIANGILSLLPDRAVASMNSGGDFSIFTQPLQPYIIKVVPHIHDVNNYDYYYGYACAEEITIGDHTGYLEMREIHMDEISGATQEEIDTIEAFLRNGVII